MIELHYDFTAEVWSYPGKGGWHFIRLPKEASAEIKACLNSGRRGWGALPVSVTIGQTKWATSIFPDAKAGAYLLPVKGEVRTKEKIEAGSRVRVLLEVLV